MECTAKITSKGQITVPREVRRALGVDAGDIVVFQGKGRDFRILPRRAANPFAKFRGSGILEVEAGREAVIRAVRELRGER